MTAYHLLRTAATLHPDKRELTDNMDTVFGRCLFALSWTVCLCANVYMNLHVYLYI